MDVVVSTRRLRAIRQEEFKAHLKALAATSRALVKSPSSKAAHSFQRTLTTAINATLSGYRRLVRLLLRTALDLIDEMSRRNRRLLCRLRSLFMCKAL